MKARFAAALLTSVALFGLTACDDPPPEKAVKIYKNLDECKADHPTETCDKAFEKAKEQHETSAPRISSREECLNKYGVEACTPKQDSAGNNWLVPAMAGFMVGQVLGNIGQPAAQPVYVDRQGSAYGNNGNQLGNYRSSCQPNDPSCRSGGFVSSGAAAGGRGGAPAPAWMANYSTTSIKPSTSSSGSGTSKTYGVVPSSRGGFGSTASDSASGYSSSIGKGGTPSTSPAATSGGASARGGFGGAAAASSSSGGG